MTEIALYLLHCVLLKRSPGIASSLYNATLPAPDTSVRVRHPIFDHNNPTCLDKQDRISRHSFPSEDAIYFERRQAKGSSCPGGPYVDLPSPMTSQNSSTNSVWPLAGSAGLTAR